MSHANGATITAAVERPRRRVFLARAMMATMMAPIAKNQVENDGLGVTAVRNAIAASTAPIIGSVLPVAGLGIGGVGGGGAVDSMGGVGVGGICGSVIGRTSIGRLGRYVSETLQLIS